MSQILDTLFDVAGTEAVYLVNPSGQIETRIAPAFYSDTMLAEIGRRLGTTMDGHEGTVQSCNELFLRFTLRCLYARRLEVGTLVVITDKNGVLNQLRVASNIVLRQLGTMAKPAAPVVSANLTAKSSPASNPSPKTKSATPPPKTKRGIWD